MSQDASGGPVRVVFFVDENYARPLSVCVRSLLDAAPAADTVEVTVVAVDLAPTTKAALTASWEMGRHTVRFVDMPAAPLLDLPSRSPFGPDVIGRHLNETVYAWLFTPELLGTSVRRAVLLDADTLVLGSLRPLHDLDLHGRPIGGAVDPHIPTIGDTYGVQAWRELGLDGAAPYVNAGVLVVDLDAWRARELTQRMLDYLATYDGRVALRDQEAVNAVLAGDVELVDPRWNVMNFWALPEGQGTTAGPGLLADPLVRHFEAGMKPWLRPTASFPHFDVYAEVDAQCVRARSGRGAPELPWPRNATAAADGGQPAPVTTSGTRTGRRRARP